MKGRITVAMLLVVVMLCSMMTMAFAASYTLADPDDQGKTGIVGGDTLTFTEDTVWAKLTARWGVRIIFQDGDEWDNTELQNELLPVADSENANTTVPESPAHDDYEFTGWTRVDENGGSAVLNDDGSVTGITGPGPIIYKAMYEPVTPVDPEEPPAAPAKPKTGSLTISKTVTGTAGDTDKLFTFTVTLDVGGTYNYTGSKSGTIGDGGTIQLKHGESVTISGLPEGTSYAVTESDNEGYEVTKTGDTGTITADAATAAVFTNNKDAVADIPAKPGKTVKPDKPDDTPVISDEPDNPDIPDEPGSPSTPDEPAVPDEVEEVNEIEELPYSPATPKTGDESNMALWIGLLLASLAGMGVCIARIRGKRK